MNQNGFSVIESMVCCAIIAVLTSISYPFLSGFKETHTLKQEMRTLYSNLQQAKVEAIKRNTFVACKINNDGYQIFVDSGECGGGPGDWERQGCEKQLVDYKYKNKVSLEKTTFSAERFRFNGRVGMKAGSMFLQNAAGRKSKLVIDVVGRIRIEDI